MLLALGCDPATRPNNLVSLTGTDNGRSIAVLVGDEIDITLQTIGLAALSHQTNFSVGCYCADETTCHRSLLRGLLLDAGAMVIDGKKPKEARS